MDNVQTAKVEEQEIKNGTTKARKHERRIRTNVDRLSRVDSIQKTFTAETAEHAENIVGRDGIPFGQIQCKE